MRFCWIIVVHKMTTKRQSSRVKSSVGRGSDVISLPQPSRVNVCLCQLFSTGSCLHADLFFSCAKNVAVGAWSRWTEVTMNYSFINPTNQNKTAWVWWSWCFPSCMWEKRGDFVTTTSCNWWNKSRFVFWVLCKWTWAARGNVQVILR